ncbi:MAG: hypothetical protein L0Y57_08390 [Beijerinckiaceae bacterium]|nr:hypothetical protein [Beijerinckiaceae bacterium]
MTLWNPYGISVSMSHIHNERTKLLANVLNGAAASSFAVGVRAPVAAALYSAGETPKVSPVSIIIGAVIWLLLAIALQLAARQVLGGLNE